MGTIRQTINIFHIRREERMATMVAMLVFSVLNALNVVANWSVQSGIMPEQAQQCIKRWHLAGFDPITYSVMTSWSGGYNEYRHPLLCFFVWPLTKLNEVLMALTGCNCAILITAVLLVFFATYSFVFLSRLFHEIIGTTRKEAYVLATLNFSFAYVMLSMIAPDHFGVSMFCLILILYISGKLSQKGKVLNWWQTIVLFVVTAGISLNNGLKVFLAALFSRRKKFFRPGYLIFAVLLPSALIWETARLTQSYMIWPKKLALKEKAKEKREAQIVSWQNSAIATIDLRDTARISFVKDSVRKAMEEQRERRFQKSAVYQHTGKPIMQGEFMGWTDATTSRWDVAVECLFGEGIMLHEDYLLGDVLVSRPVIVRYQNWFNYIVEGLLVLLFLGGIISIFKSPSLFRGGQGRGLLGGCALSFFLMDMALHMGLGFGINEISIMSAHYLYVLPICMAYLLVGLGDKWRKRMTIGIGAIATYLVIWNVTLLIEYLYFD